MHDMAYRICEDAAQNQNGWDKDNVQIGLKIQATPSSVFNKSSLTTNVALWLEKSYN